MLQDNEVINNSFEGARPLYPVFEAEKDAECSVYEALERFKLEYKKQYTLKSKKLRLDLVIKHDGFCYPIEVKPDLSSKKLRKYIFIKYFPNTIANILNSTMFFF